jgi:polyribonucleotide nucleotidyltransferase
MNVNPITPKQEIAAVRTPYADLETGEMLATHGAVMVSLDDTRVWHNRQQSKPTGFFPLTVDYMERTYAAGRIPGGFFKREGRPTGKETLTSRHIDRPSALCFDGFWQVQVATVVNNEIDSKHSRADRRVCCIGAVRYTVQRPDQRGAERYADGQYILNPTATELRPPS